MIKIFEQFFCLLLRRKTHDMKLYVKAASDPCGTEGRIIECESLEKYFDEVASTHDFGDWIPEIIVSDPKRYGRYTCPEAAKGCDYIIEIYDDWIE